MRYPPAAFRQKELFVHAFLADVPLHDVWAIPLAGGGNGRIMPDVLAALDNERLDRVNPLTRGLFGLRFLLGRLFGWDRDMDQVTAASYIHRLTPAEHGRSLATPGTLQGAFRTVYLFENESLGEIVNATVHAFSLLALEPADEGYTLYWAIYVKKVSWLTPFYMWLIDPFRRFIVYPAIIKQIRRSWLNQQPETPPIQP